MTIDPASGAAYGPRQALPEIQPDPHEEAAARAVVASAAASEHSFLVALEALMAKPDGTGAQGGRQGRSHP